MFFYNERLIFEKFLFPLIKWPISYRLFGQRCLVVRQIFYFKLSQTKSKKEITIFL